MLPAFLPCLCAPDSPFSPSSPISPTHAWCTFHSLSFSGLEEDCGVTCGCYTLKCKMAQAKLNGEEGSPRRSALLLTMRQGTDREPGLGAA